MIVSWKIIRREVFEMSRIQLFINGLPSPLGVPKSGLEFSWKYTGISSPQASYRLSVALSRDDLNAPVYDSGVVVSSDHLNICVPAACFPCRTALYACVSVTLEDGTSLVSELTEFSVTDGSWNAEWIWKDDSVRVNDYAVFQRKFTVKNAPRFCAYICFCAS